MAPVRWTAAAILLSGLPGCFGGAAERSDEVAPAKNAAAAAREQGGDAKAARGFVDAKKLRIIEGKGWLVEEEGFLKIAGEVKNDSGQWITSVRVTIRLYDAAGKEIRTDSITTEVAKDVGEEVVESVYSDRTFVPPGETAVFYFTRDAKKIRGKYASHRLTARARVAEDPPSVSLSGFEARKEADGTFYVRGQIENGGRVGCRSPKAVLGLYGEGGKLIGAVSETPDAMFQKVLAPGRKVAVERRSIELSGLPISRIQGFADCDVP